MYDAGQVVVDSVTRLIRKKPELFRASMRRNVSRIIDCNPKGKVTPFEHGDKISKMIKKVNVNSDQKRV